MNKPVMPEPDVAAVFATSENTPSVRKGYEMGGYEKVPPRFSEDCMEAHHAAWEAHCAALEARLRDVEEFVQRWRTDGRVLFDDPHSDWRNGRGYAMLECADELTATLEQSNG